MTWRESAARWLLRRDSQLVLVPATGPVGSPPPVWPPFSHMSADTPVTRYHVEAALELLELYAGVLEDLPRDRWAGYEQLVGQVGRARTMGELAAPFAGWPSPEEARLRDLPDLARVPIHPADDLDLAGREGLRLHLDQIGGKYVNVVGPCGMPGVLRTASSHVLRADPLTTLAVIFDPHANVARVFDRDPYGSSFAAAPEPYSWPQRPEDLRILPPEGTVLEIDRCQKVTVRNLGLAALNAVVAEGQELYVRAQERSYDCKVTVTMAGGTADIGSLYGDNSSLTADLSGGARLSHQWAGRRVALTVRDASVQLDVPPLNRPDACKKLSIYAPSGVVNVRTFGSPSDAEVVAAVADVRQGTRARVTLNGRPFSSARTALAELSDYIAPTTGIAAKPLTDEPGARR